MTKNWYPVINEDNCIECGACIIKCPNGVYQKDSTKPVVIYPEGCIDQCTGCQALCPAEAIEYYGSTAKNANGNKTCGCGSCRKKDEEEKPIVQVDVFGIREEAPISSCSCGGACGSVIGKTMGEMYEDLVRFFYESDLATDVGLHFIDVFEDDLKGYDTPHTMFKSGFALPLVAVNGVVRFHGWISNSKIYDEVRKGCFVNINVNPEKASIC